MPAQGWAAMDDSNVFAPGFVERPFWWESAAPHLRSPDIPSRADVVVIGGGIAGLSTALELGRNGVDVVVLDRDPIGWGASSRNGGALAGAAGLGRANPKLQQQIDGSVLEAMVEEAEAAFEGFEQ